MEPGHFASQSISAPSLSPPWLCDLGLDATTYTLRDTPLPDGDSGDSRLYALAEQLSLHSRIIRPRPPDTSFSGEFCGCPKGLRFFRLSGPELTNPNIRCEFAVSSHNERPRQKPGLSTPSQPVRRLNNTKIGVITSIVKGECSRFVNGEQIGKICPDRSIALDWNIGSVPCSNPSPSLMNHQFSLPNNFFMLARPLRFKAIFSTRLGIPMGWTVSQHSPWRSKGSRAI